MTAAASRDLPLLIFCVVSISGCSPLPTDPPGVPKPQGAPADTADVVPPLPTDDYDLLEVTTLRPYHDKRVTRTRCAYDPCAEGQTSCAELAAIADCLCPGSTPNTVVPDAPALRSVSWNGSDVVARWCAPYSYVRTYVVTVGGQERGEFGRERRSGALGLVENIAEVCVTAVNDSGGSEGACTMYSPEDGGSVALKAGLIGGAVGLLLLLLLLVVVLCRRRRRLKQEGGTSRH